MQTSLARAAQPHSRSAARKRNTKQALCHWKTRLESRCFRAWRTYYTVQTSRRRVFWNHVAIVRGKLAVRCRCFRRWARLPRFCQGAESKDAVGLPPRVPSYSQVHVHPVGGVLQPIPNRHPMRRGTGRCQRNHYRNFLPRPRTWRRKPCWDVRW